MQLPEISTLQDYRTLDLKSAIFVEAARDILHSLKFPVNSISHTTDGSSPVVLIDDNYVVKFFAPIFSDAFEMEKSALEFYPTSNPRRPICSVQAPPAPGATW